MEERDKTDYTEDAVNRIQSRKHLVYQNKANRDRAFKMVKAAGLNARRSTTRNQQLHPEHIEDYVGKIETGFGNTMYETVFPVLYVLEIRNEYDGRR